MKKKFVFVSLLIAFSASVLSCDDGFVDEYWTTEDENQNGDKDEEEDSNEDGGETEADLSWIKEVDGHPRLMFHIDELPKIRERSLQPGWPEAMRKTMLADAETYYNDKSMTPFKIARSGYYSNLTCGRALGTYVVNLAFCAYLTGEQKYITRAKEILVSAVELTEPGAIQNNDVMTPEVEKAIADNLAGIPVNWTTHLQNGDGAYAMALGYDLLYPYMSAEERVLVKEELQKFGEWLPDHAEGYVYHNEAPAACNHTTVHFGALGLIGLNLNNDIWTDMAMEYVSDYFRFSADNTGYIMEGHSYQGYGLAGAMPFTLALIKNGKSDLTKTYEGVISNPSWGNGAGKTFAPDMYFTADKYKDYCSLTGDQLLWKVLPNKHTVSMNDSRDEPIGEAAILGAIMNNKPEQVWAWLENSGFNDSGVFKPQSLLSTCTRPYLFLVGDPVQPLQPTENTIGLQYKFTSGRVFARSGWGSRDDAYLGFTSGYDSHHGHNHADENHVIFAALGEQFLYDAEYEGSFSNFHSLIHVGKGEQPLGVENDHGVSGITRGSVGKLTYENNDTYVKKWGLWMIGESKYTYNKDANVSRSNRKLVFVREAAPYVPYIFFRDDIQLNNGQKSEFTTYYVTTTKNTLSPATDGKSVVITGSETGGKAVVMAFINTIQLTLNIDDLTGKFYIKGNNGKKVQYDKLIKRISGVTSSQNLGRITTFVFPYRYSYQLPKVEVFKGTGEDINTMYYKISFTDANNTVHKFKVTDSSVEWISSDDLLPGEQ